MSTEHQEWRDSEHDAVLDGVLDAELDAELEAELDAGDQIYRDALASLFRVPADLRDRTHIEVEQALLSRSTLLAGVDLLGTGWRTLRFMFGPTPGNDLPADSHLLGRSPMPSPSAEESP